MSDPVKAITGQIRRRCAALATTTISGQSSVPWRSLLFDGGHHRIALNLSGDHVEAAIDAIRDGIGSDDFTISGHLIAELALSEIDRSGGDALITLDALTIQA
jgi:hypothetical protein